MSALVGLALAAGIAGAAGGWMLYQHFAEGLPDVDGLRGYQPRVMSRVFASDGELLADLATERRIYLPINAIPQIVRQAFVSAEDNNFYSHKGVDPLAILRAAATNLMNRDRGKRPIGASTITQQVAKNMLLDNEVTFARKAKEAILAFRIEKTLTKNQILELYLNEIYLGLGAYGVAAASEAYFNKPLDQLTVPEAAFLAALPKAPNNYNPFRNPELAQGATRPGAGPDDRGRRADPGASRGIQAGADRPGRIPASAGRLRRRLVRRGCATPIDRPVRPGQCDRGRVAGADQPGPGVAGRRQQGAA